MLTGKKDVRPAATQIERDLDEAAYYYFFAINFGWTEEQVESNRDRLNQLLPVVHGIHQEIADDRQREQEAADMRERELNGQR